MKDLFAFLLIGIAIFVFISSTSLNEYEHETQVLAEEVVANEDLHPYIREQADKLVEQAAAIGIEVVIVEGYRSHERQDELYAQGRTVPGNIVTYAQAGQSYHNYGLAIDYALRQATTGEIIWDIEYDGNQNGQSDWFEVAEIGKKLGFDWGGDWRRFKDYPHLQMDFGLSLDELNWVE